jgi:hypothetical protein
MFKWCAAKLQRRLDNWLHIRGITGMALHAIVAGIGDTRDDTPPTPDSVRISSLLSPLYRCSVTQCLSAWSVTYAHFFAVWCRTLCVTRRALRSPPIRIRQTDEEDARMLIFASAGLLWVTPHLPRFS